MPSGYLPQSHPGALDPFFEAALYSKTELFIKRDRLAIAFPGNAQEFIEKRLSDAHSLCFRMNGNGKLSEDMAVLAKLRNGCAIT